MTNESNGIIDEPVKPWAIVYTGSGKYLGRIVEHPDVDHVVLSPAYEYHSSVKGEQTEAGTTFKRERMALPFEHLGSLKRLTLRYDLIATGDDLDAGDRNVLATLADNADNLAGAMRLGRAGLVPAKRMPKVVR